MKTGFIIPNYSNEKRVALLPNDIDNFENELIVETGFGSTMDISDDAYLNKGCKIASREEIFKTCDAIFSLKLIQPSDYNYLREKQMIVGWTHPNGSGRPFMEAQAIPKNLLIVDLDNVFPKVYYREKSFDIPWLPHNFIKKNSINAGASSTIHALVNFGLLPSSNTKVAILSAGNVAQGAFQAITKFGCETYMFYRKTMYQFYETIQEYDVIINGIEVEKDPIINKGQLKNIKPGALIIDAAADAGRAIIGTHYTKINDPIYKEDGLYYYEVNNSPSIFYRKSSVDISESFSKFVYKEDLEKYWSLVQ